MSGIIGSAGSKSGIIDPKYCFWVRGMGSTYSLAANNIFYLGDTVAYNNTVYNHGNVIASDGLCTAKVSGLWTWGCTIYCYGVVDGDNFMVTAQTSGSLGSLGDTVVAKGWRGGTITGGTWNFQEYLQAGDTFRVKFHNENNAVSVYHADTYHAFWGGLAQ